MSAAWTKFKMWTRVVVFSAAAIYVLIFIILNREHTVKLHFVFKEYPDVNVLVLLMITCVSSIIGWWLFKTIFITMRQMRTINRRFELERIERQHNDMLSKAARLQTKPEEMIAKSESELKA